MIGREVLRTAHEREDDAGKVVRPEPIDDVARQRSGELAVGNVGVAVVHDNGDDSPRVEAIGGDVRADVTQPRHRVIGSVRHIDRGEREDGPRLTVLQHYACKEEQHLPASNSQ